MGRKSGAGHVGAKGKAKTATPEKSSAVTEALEEAALSRLETLARDHTEPALATLREVSDEAIETPGARVSAARALIDYGWGRPSQRVPLVDDGGGLTIQILNYSGRAPDVAIVEAKAEPEVVEVEAEP